MIKFPFFEKMLNFHGDRSKVAPFVEKLCEGTAFPK